MIIARIARNVGLDAQFLGRIARTASHRYKTYSIPKKTGGMRVIAHPSKELKFLQRWLVDNLFSNLPVHKSVYSYRNGVGIRDHALAHAQQNYLLRVDFSNFFPSIKASDIARLLSENREKFPFQLNKQDLKIICSIVCKNEQLTIGAPSSPVLSNAILYTVDKYWTTRCKRSGIVYTRYADDLYFSTCQPNILDGVFSDLQTYIQKLESPKLQINRDKTVFTSRKRKRHVTGLVLTSENKVSLGRNKKRWVRGLVYKFKSNQLTDEQTSYLRGYLAFAMEVEPSFYQSLETKYGKELLRSIFQ